MSGETQGRQFAGTCELDGAEMKSRRDAATWGFSYAFSCYQPYAAMRRSISLLHPFVKNIMPQRGEAFGIQKPLVNLLPHKPKKSLILI